jgi:hypothetical protein
MGWLFVMIVETDRKTPTAKAHDEPDPESKQLGVVLRSQE